MVYTLSTSYDGFINIFITIFPENITCENLIEIIFFNETCVTNLKIYLYTFQISDLLVLSSSLQTFKYKIPKRIQFF